MELNQNDNVNNDVNTNIKMYNNVYKVKKTQSDYFEYQTISPIFHWILKIKNTKIELWKIIKIKNNLFKQFIKKNNKTLSVNLINNQYNFINFFENFINTKFVYTNSLYKFGYVQNSTKTNINVYENYQIVNKMHPTENIIMNLVNKNNFVNIYKRETLKDWYTYNLINFEVSLLFFNFYVIKLNDLGVNENNINNFINVSNWKTYAWHTKKKFI